MLSTTPNKSITSGRILRDGEANNKDENIASSALVPTPESIFYEWDGDTTQQSLVYNTTFETIENSRLLLNSLYVVVFPTGIRLAPAMYQQLVLQMRSADSSVINTWPVYKVPLKIRDYKDTVTAFRYNTSGNKIATATSNIGVIYTTPIASSSDSFRDRFQWFMKPPLRTGNSKSKTFNSEKCPYYKTSEYKCVPFNQLHDLSGSTQDAYVIPGNMSLKNILDDKSSSKINGNIESFFNQISTEDVIEYSAIVTSSVIVLFIAGLIISRYIK